MFSLLCCAEQPPVEVTWPVMGTVASVSAPAGRRADLAGLRSCAGCHFEQTEKDLSHWRTNSWLSTVNAAAGTPKTFSVAKKWVPLIRTAIELSERSGNAFTPLAGPLMQAWGFLQPDVPMSTLPPSIDSELLAVTNILFDGTTLRLKHPGMQLDLGAIAKGYAVDLAYNDIRRRGISNALINLGGNLRALGDARPGEARGWRTGIRNPFDTTQVAASFVLTNGQAVATSGNYERYVTIHGKRYAHIMDPRTQHPAQGVAACTVVAPTAMLADGLSTTLYILGPEAGQRLLNAHYSACAAVWIPEAQPLQMITTSNFPAITRLPAR